MFAKAVRELHTFTRHLPLSASSIQMAPLVNQMNQFWHIINQNPHFIEDFLSFHYPSYVLVSYPGYHLPVVRMSPQAPLGFRIFFILNDLEHFENTNQIFVE